MGERKTRKFYKSHNLNTKTKDNLSLIADFGVKNGFCSTLNNFYSRNAKTINEDALYNLIVKELIAKGKRLKNHNLTKDERELIYSTSFSII